MPDYVRRALRTALQLVASGGLTAFVAVLTDGLTAQQAGLVLAGFQVLVTFAQNLAEDKTSFPSLLKATASSGSNPVTDDPVN